MVLLRLISNQRIARSVDMLVPSTGRGRNMWRIQDPGERSATANGNCTGAIANGSSTRSTDMNSTPNVVSGGGDKENMILCYTILYVYMKRT